MELVRCPPNIWIILAVYRFVIMGDGCTRQFEDRPLDEIRGKVDIGIIAFREDEFNALLERFPPEDHVRGERYYAISHVRTIEADKYVVAIVRCPESGETEAQGTAHDLIMDIDPGWILVVGIAGGIPSDEFTLGDVIVSTRIVDFTRAAIHDDKATEYDLAGGPVHKKIKGFVAHLQAMSKELGNWNDIPISRPEVVITKKNAYGPPEWQDKVIKALQHHFGAPSSERKPIVKAGTIASSDRLVKSSEIIQRLLSAVRSILAVEMEVAGIYHASLRAEQQYPVVAIRGISDIVGYQRDPSGHPTPAILLPLSHMHS